MESREVVDECLVCRKPIYYGNALVSMNRNVEQVDRTKECLEGEVTVIDSDQLLSLSGSCGNHFSTDRLRELISSAVMWAADRK